MIFKIIYLLCSLALSAFAHLLIFDLLSILVALVSLSTERKKANIESYTFGYQRFEVVGVFSASILAILFSFFQLKESVERLFEPNQIYHHHMIIPCALAFAVHLIVVYGVDNTAFSHVIQACGSSWIQEHTTDISRTICRFVPGFSRFLLPRLNPISLIGAIVSSAISVIYLIMIARPEPTLDLNFSDPLPDTIGAIIISLVFFGTMIPMTMYSGCILLQTIPAHLIGPLDKALREASTVDGVLELQKEHIWSLGFKDLVGSLYVRVRRDANEQMVLAQVTSRLSSIVKHLTIQVYKDDWTRTANTYPTGLSFANSAANNNNNTNNLPNRH